MFEVTMKHSEESLAALSRMQFDLFGKKSRIVRMALSLGFMILGVVYFSKWWGILSLAYGGYLSTGVYNYANYKARKISKQIKDEGLAFPASRYLFDASAMHIYALPEDSECGEPLHYSQVLRLGEDSDNYYVFPTKYGGYMIPKAALGERSEEFKAFLEGKTGKYFEARRSPFRQLQEFLRRKSDEPYHL